MNYQTQEAQAEDQRIGVWTEANPDKIDLLDIRNAKSQLLFHLSHNSDYGVQLTDAQNYAVAMLIFMEKHFGQNENEQIKDYRVEAQFGDAVRKYNFYDLVKIMPKMDDIDRLRNLIKLETNIYDHFNNLLNVGLPTSHLKPSQKLVMKLFSLIPDKEILYADMIREYKATLKLCHARPSNLNLLSFVISKMAFYGLDFFDNTVGFAQSGKSTLTFLMIRNGLCFKAKTPYTDAIKSELTSIIQNNTAYNEEDDLNDKFAIALEKDFWYDEGYLAADRRNAMKKQVKDLSHQINVNAVNHNRTYLLIQNSSDMDLRFLNKANIFILIKERGLAYVFVRASNYPIIKDYLGFEKFVKNPELLQNSASADFALESLPSYCFKVRWLSQDNNPEFQLYLSVKKQRRQPKPKEATIAPTFTAPTKPLTRVIDSLSVAEIANLDNL